MPENHVNIPTSTRSEERKNMEIIIASLKKLCKRTKHKLYKFISAATKAMEHAMEEKYDDFLNEMRTALILDIPWGFRIQILNRLFRVRKFLMERSSGSSIQQSDLERVWNMNIPDSLVKGANNKMNRGYTREDARELFTTNETNWELKMMEK